MHRIYVADKLAEVGLSVLEQTEGIEVDHRPGLQGSELLDAISQADGMIVRSGIQVTEELMQAGNRLKAIVRAGVGVDNIDLSAATRAGIVVMNTPDGNTVSTAEHTIAMLMALCRKIPSADTSMKNGQWDRSSFVGTQLEGKVAGIIGLGRVGWNVAKRLIAMGVRVIGYDPFFTSEKADEAGIQKVDEIDDMIGKVDIVSVHVPLTEATRNLIDSNRLSKMKPGCLILNCARGGIVNEEALLNALNQGTIGGAGLDVFVNEPPTDRELIDHPKTIVTPHLGASTNEAQLNVAKQASELLVDYLIHGVIRHSVNVMSIDPEQLRICRRELDLAWRLGLLLSNLSNGSLQSASIELKGEACHKNVQLICAGFAKGLMQNAMEETVTLANALALAKDRGIRIDSHTSTESTDFRTLLSGNVRTEQGTWNASATTRGNQFNRLVRLQEYRLDTFLEGWMLIYEHEDSPGLIGFIGTKLGEVGCNISGLNMGSNERGKNAVAVLSLDSAPDQEVLDSIAMHEKVTQVRLVELPGFGVEL